MSLNDIAYTGYSRDDVRYMNTDCGISHSFKVILNSYNAQITRKLYDRFSQLDCYEEFTFPAYIFLIKYLDESTLRKEFIQCCLILSTVK